MKQRIVLTIGIILLLLIVGLVAEYLYMKHNGSVVPAPTIPRTTQTLGHGPPLTYIVMGDSTSIGQGTSYDHSYALASAQHLAEHHTVSFINVGISGATTKTVLTQQLAKAASYKPDVVLLGVGANDAVHYTSGDSIQRSLRAIVSGLKTANPHVRIVVTGSPAVDGASRFIWPYKQVMELRTTQVNNAFKPVIADEGLTFAPIAAKTRTAFRADPTLLAADKFHPNARGYALWIPIINDALDRSSLTLHTSSE